MLSGEEIEDQLKFEITESFVKHSEAKIKEIICEYFNIPVDHLMVKTRRSHIVYPRQMFAYVLREHFGLTWQCIASFCGEFDHSTIIHAHRKIKSLLKTNTDVMYDMEQIIARIAPLTADKLKQLQELKQIKKTKASRKGESFAEDRKKVYFYMSGVNYAKAYERPSSPATASV